MLLLALPLGTLSQDYEVLEDGTFLLEDFEDYEKGSIPGNWYDRDGNQQLSEYGAEFLSAYRYRILEQDGNKFLRYEGTDAKHINYPLANKESINIHQTPILSWKVRAHELPVNANEDNNKRNDSVASVYVVFDMGSVLFREVPKSIRYSWSTTRSEGSEYSKLFGNQRIIIVETGRDRTGEWVTFERNIVEDYRRLFGEMPPETPLAILILSDGDSTGSFVKADYDDLMLKPSR